MDTSFLNSFAVEPDTSRADWVRQHCFGGLFTFHRYVPKCFDSYVRMCHPGWRWPEEDDPLAEGFVNLSDVDQARAMIPIRWDDAAKLCGRSIDVELKWYPRVPNFKAPEPGDIAPPLDGVSTLRILEGVFEVLLAHSGPDTECVLAIWDGYGNQQIAELENVRGSRIQGLGQGSHFILSARLGTALDRWHLAYTDMIDPAGSIPQTIWPTTQDWFFTVPFDMPQSLFGGPEVLADEMLALDQIEAYREPPMQGKSLIACY